MYFKFQCVMYCGYFINLHTSMCNVHSVYDIWYDKDVYIYTHTKNVPHPCFWQHQGSRQVLLQTACTQCTSSKLFKKSTIKCTLSKLTKNPSSTANCLYSVHHQNYLKSTIKCTLSKLTKHPSSSANSLYNVHHQNYAIAFTVYIIKTILLPLQCALSKLYKMPSKVTT